MQFEPIIYNSADEYHTFVCNLLQFNRNDPQRGRLVIETAGSTKAYTLKPIERENWLLWLIHLFYKPRSERAKDLGEFAISLFEKNKKWAQGEAMFSLRGISAIESVFALDEATKGKLNQFKKELEATYTQSGEAHKTALEKESQAAIDLIHRQTEEQVRSITAEAEKNATRTIEVLVQHGTKELDRDQAEAAKIEKSNAELTAQLQQLDQHLTKYYDTILVARDNKPVICNMKAIEEIEFMKSFIRTHMKGMTIPITDEERKQYPNLQNKIGFTDYSEECLTLALDFSRDKKDIETIVSAETLFELYELADFLQFDALKKATQKCLIEDGKISLDFALELLHKDNAFMP